MMVIASFLTALLVAAHGAVSVRHPASDASTALRRTPSPYVQSKAQQPDPVDRDRALLDSFGACPRTTQIREYVPEDGGLARDYATDLPFEEALDKTTTFYRSKVAGWENIELHAAIEGYTKNNQEFLLSRSGPDDIGLPPRARLLKSTPAPPGTTFYFTIEARQKR